MIGFFIVESFSTDKDSQGFETGVHVAVKYDMNLKGFLYLPPHLRKSQCNITVGSEIFGVMDEVSGLGAAMFGVNCDIDFKNKADYEFTKTLTVVKDITCSTGDIKASVGDVKATTVSLKTHYHPIITMTGDDAAQVVASASSGNPAAFTKFATTVPGVLEP